MTSGDVEKDWRPGASAAGPGDEEPALPQVVWLRGDEPFCGDFSLDAEAVMARLGIKRTRLTQISGRELRVGRIRRGRYVAPVYREEDVEAYTAWTRPTATHLKSSQVLEDAARVLTGQGEDIVDRVSDEMARYHGEDRRLLAEQIEVLAQHLDAERDRAVRAEAKVTGQLKVLEGKIEAISVALEKLAFLQTSWNRDVAELRAVTRGVSDELARELKKSFGSEIAGAVKALTPPPKVPKKKVAPKKAKAKAAHAPDAPPSVGSARRAARLRR